MKHLSEKKQTDGNLCLSSNRTNLIKCCFEFWIINSVTNTSMIASLLPPSCFTVGITKQFSFSEHQKLLFFKEQEIVLKYVTCFDKYRGAIRVTFWQTLNYLYTQYPKVTKKVHAAKISHKDVVPFQHKSPKQIPQCYQLRLPGSKLYFGPVNLLPSDPALEAVFTVVSDVTFLLGMCCQVRC